MKQKKVKFFLVIISAVTLGCALLIFFNLPKSVTASNASFNLNQIADGTYLGNCDNGLVKVQVQVSVQNHNITDVQLIKHDNGLGSAANSITENVIKQQSVEVQAVSGATYSSKTILKAVENALTEGWKRK